MSELHQLLICSGLDPSGGAGFMADCAVARAHNVRPVGVVTASTVQATTGVTAVFPVEPQVVRQQLETLCSDVRVHAVKIGMLGNLAVAREVFAIVATLGVPVVLDPIFRPTRGGVALFAEHAALDDFCAELAKLAKQARVVITPNAAELALLGRGGVSDHASAVALAQRLAADYGVSVLVKGGHLPRSGQLVVDTLVESVTSAHEIASGELRGATDVHGTGCALATAVAARLAIGATLVEACSLARRWLVETLAHPISPGNGASSVV